MSDAASNPVDDHETGPFGRGGQTLVGAMLSFHGRLGPAFLAFAAARARRLDLTGWAVQDGDCVRVMLQGPEALIGAFEVACCIGPDEDEVLGWTNNQIAPNHSSSGFELRGMP